ncbi:hypothetical protein Bca4012_011003 [Brassica carinata]
MEEELRNLSKVWIYALISISYCYFISSRISKGVLRLLSIIPVCILFLVLPLFLSSLHFSGSSTLFLSWLANFNLLLFAFDQGPLCPLPSNLCRFFCFACFPIKVRQKPSPNAITNRKNEPMPEWVFAVKVLAFGVLLHVYEYRDILPRFVVLALYCLHIYLEAELVLVLVGAVVSTLLGCDIEPVFNEPYLATSLHDFWSRRCCISGESCGLRFRSRSLLLVFGDSFSRWVSSEALEVEAMESEVVHHNQEKKDHEIGFS